MRYRGYYYDIETGLYYLRARYYDPEVGRFINADDINYLTPESINGLNLFAYCYNDPVNLYDPYGTFAITLSVLAIWGLVALFSLATLTYVESQTHFIGNTIDAIGEFVIDVYKDISSWIGSWVAALLGNWGNTLTSDATIINNNHFLISEPVQATIGENVLFYQRKRPALRDRSSTKKEAKEKAFRKGGKKPPRGPEDHGHGPHYHPFDPDSHDHYFFPDRFFRFSILMNYFMQRTRCLICT